jgi:polysaccharide chain length determinant protein (PEP-CTERM system associated)
MNDMIAQLLAHLREAWRYRWQAVGLAWVVAAAGWTAVYLVPDRYEAHARVYVDTQSMLRPLLTGLAVQPNVDQMVTMMSRTLVSRLNLEKVVAMDGMDGVGGSADGGDQEIARRSRELSIRSAGRENLYTISYADQDRMRAKRVVEAVLTIFMQGSIGDKRRDSDAARRFIEEQLSSYSEKLVAAENAVTAFKRRHQGLMPNEGQDYYVRLSDARAALRQATLDYREAVNARDAIKQQLAGDTQRATRAAEKGDAAKPESDIDARIRAHEQRLDALRLTYTDQHPDVVAMSRIIAQLKEQKAAEDKVESTAPRPPQGPVYEQLRVSLANAEATVAAMKARVEEYTSRHSELQAAANALPQIEAEYKQLTRDYEVIKSRYDKLLERRESAQISGDVEASDAAMGFRVIDPPQVPIAPSYPNRPQLFSLVLLGALGGGLAFALLLSQVKTTFNDERSLKEATGLQVLGTISMAWNEEQMKRRSRGLLAFAFSVLSLLSAYAAVMVSLVMSVSRA